MHLIVVVLLIYKVLNNIFRLLYDTIVLNAKLYLEFYFRLLYTINKAIWELWQQSRYIIVDTIYSPRGYKSINKNFGVTLNTYGFKFQSLYQS